MKYNLSNPQQRERFISRAKELLDNNAPLVELQEKKPLRTRSQNSYLHVVLSYFASAYGVSAEFVKERYFKRLCNPHLFLVYTTDPMTGERVEWLRSSAQLTTAELTVAIERFRIWSAMEAGIYIPEANEYKLLAQAEITTSQNTEFI